MKASGPKYPHLASNPRIPGGVPIIRGTRIAVRTVAGYDQLGLSPDEILQSLPHLTLSQVHAALAGALPSRGHDAVHGSEEKRLVLSHEAQLRFATAAARSLPTFNVGDFVRLPNGWVKVGREHADIIVSKQLPSGEALPPPVGPHAGRNCPLAPGAGPVSASLCRSKFGANSP